MREKWELQHLQALPLSLKVRLTEQRIREWVNEYGEEGVYVSFSGGKDSTVLLDIARKMYPNLKGVFFDTGLEFPEIRDFVRTFDNIDWIKPKMTFKEVIQKYGYPFISKEVAECVYGARRYLTQIIEDERLLDRQTDRQTDRPAEPENCVTSSSGTNSQDRASTRPRYHYWYDKLTGQGRYQMSHKSDRGGYDRKYRKVRGIAEFSSDKAKGRGPEIPTGEDARNAGSGESDPGHPP